MTERQGDISPRLIPFRRSSLSKRHRLPWSGKVASERRRRNKKRYPGDLQLLHVISEVGRNFDDIVAEAAAFGSIGPTVAAVDGGRLAEGNWEACAVVGRPRRHETQEQGAREEPGGPHSHMILPRSDGRALGPDSGKSGTPRRGARGRLQRRPCRPATSGSSSRAMGSTESRLGTRNTLPRGFGK